VKRTPLTINISDWRVLDGRDGKTLMLSNDIIERHPYNATRFCSAWEESALRARLGEQFLLSVEEVSRYFEDSAARISYYQGKPRAWWLRDIGIKNHAAFVGKDGEISAHGYRVDCAWCGVRPAMWVNCKQESETGMDIEMLHTTAVGEERIRRNLGLKSDDIVAWCRQAVRDADDSAITRKGKNWYVSRDDFTLTINAHSHTIITARKTKRERGKYDA
jgi:hypothetical protein